MSSGNDQPIVGCEQWVMVGRKVKNADVERNMAFRVAVIANKQACQFITQMPSVKQFTPWREMDTTAHLQTDKCSAPPEQCPRLALALQWSTCKLPGHASAHHSKAGSLYSLPEASRSQRERTEGGKEWLYKCHSPSASLIWVQTSVFQKILNPLTGIHDEVEFVSRRSQLPPQSSVVISPTISPLAPPIQ